MIKNVVVFGGGSGLSTTLKAIKTIKDINISAVVTVADSGGSTGVIRHYYKSPALGDLRRVIGSLSQKETFFNDLMEYRFKQQNKQSPLDNHSLGNLIMLALNEKYGFYDGVRFLSDVLKIKGEVIPLTDNEECELQAEYEDGTIAEKEHNIPNEQKKIKTISYKNDVNIKVNPRVIEAIRNADLIVFSFGSLYTSIIASIALSEVKKVLIENKDKKFVYLCNIVTQPGETDNMNAYDHINAIEEHLEHGIIDYILINNDTPSKELLEKYSKTNSKMVEIDNNIKKSHCIILSESLIDNSNHEHIRHDIKKINKAFKKLLLLLKED